MYVVLPKDNHYVAHAMFTPASSWEYSFFAPHSMATVIELMGGNTTFVNRV